MGKKQKKSKTPSQGNKKKNTDDQNKKCDSTEGKSGSEMNVEQLVTPKSAVNSGNQKESMELSNVQKASKDDDNGHQSADSWDQQDDNGRYDNLPLKTTDDIAGNSKGTKHSTAFSNLNAKAKAWDNEEITTSLNDLKVDSHYNDPWSEYRKKDSKDINLRNPSETNANKSFNAPSNWGSSSRTTHQSYDKNEKVDDGFKEFEVALKSASPKTVNYLKVKEVTGDLFAMGEDYALAHCVAEDMSMGSGIAVQFRRDFKRVDELLQQRVHQGGLAILEIKSRFIYYLVTKRESSGKPTLEKFYCSVRKWRDHVKENNVKKVAIPRLGCGLDRLEWDTVKFMLEYLFKDVNVEITVCNFQQNHGQTKQKLQQTSKSSGKSGKKSSKKKK